MASDKHDVDNFFAFLDDVLTPDTENVAARQAARATIAQSHDATKQVNAQTGNTLAGIINTSTKAIAGNIDSAVGAIDSAGARGEKLGETGLAMLGTPGGKALVTGAATAIGGPAAGGFLGGILNGLGGTPSAATPKPAPPPPPPPPPADNTGKVALGIGVVALALLMKSRSDNART